MTSQNPRDGTPSTVAEHMVRGPKLCGPATTVGDVRELFHDDHVHAALVVADGTLLAVVERSDIDSAPPDLAAQQAGGLHERVVGPDADLDATWRAMTASGRRRLAVVDEQHTLLGLLCLKRSGRGFCSDDDVRERAESRAQCS